MNDMNKLVVLLSMMLLLSVGAGASTGQGLAGVSSKDDTAFEVLELAKRGVELGIMTNDEKMTETSLRSIEELYDDYHAAESVNPKLMKEICSALCDAYYQGGNIHIDYYHDAAVWLIRNKQLLADDKEMVRAVDYFTYSLVMLSTAVYQNPELGIDEAIKAFEEDKQNMAGCGIEGIDYIFDYLFGTLYDINPGTMSVVGITPKHEKARAYYESAVAGLEKYSEPYYKNVLLSSYIYLGHYYRNMRHLVSAYEYYRKALDLSFKHWQLLGLPAPWTIPLAGEDDLIGEYVDCLIEAGRYQDVAEFCSNSLEKIESGELADAKDLYKTKQWLQNKYTMVAAVLNGDAPEETLTADNFEDIQDAETNEAVMHSFELLDKGEFSELIEYDEAFLKRVYNVSKENLEDEALIKSGWEEWHNMLSAIAEDEEQTVQYNRANDILLIFRCLSSAYQLSGDFENALKYSKHVYEITRTDSKFAPNEREELNSRFANRELYYSTELSCMLDLARIYGLCGQFDKSSEMYQKASELNYIRLQPALALGSASSKMSRWGTIQASYDDISSWLFNLMQVGWFKSNGLAMEVNSLSKSFWQDYNAVLEEAVKQSTPEAQKALASQKAAERGLEQAYHTGTGNAETYFAEIDKADYVINKSVDMKQVIDQSVVKISDLQKALKPNDIVVDFYEFVNPNDSTVRIVDGKRKAFYTPSIVANIMRAGWTSPMVMPIGTNVRDLISGGMLKDKGKDWIDYLYYSRDNQASADLYNSELLANLIWGPIIMASGAKDGENIYFVPSATIDRIAIENLAPQGVPISSRFNIHRISSLRQLGKETHKYKSTDKCIAFGGIADYEGKGQAKEGESGIMASDSRGILERNHVPSLRQTESLINTVRIAVPNTKQMLGSTATKPEFMKLDGNSPNMLVLATHGFNFSNDELSEAQQEALFGNRDMEMSEMEYGLLTSGLYLANPKGGDVQPIDGILTARDISMMNLDNVGVAMLVCCSSAVGLSGKNGTYGLVRALKIAGVKTVIGSLWDVDVEATQMLFEKFFGYYTSGSDCREAMKKAQHDVKNYRGYDESGQLVSYKSPYYWAGFIVID
ncbi:MAG TPA: hypothetical protein DC009_05935 [Porphyromonadaceae bacterium]|nr:hypothetical protein [Porphyromonadaceae bacterium]